MAKTDRIIIISWFGKKCAKTSNINQTRKQVISNPEVFLESGSLKYCSKLQGEYKNSKSGAGTSVGPSNNPWYQFKQNSRDTVPLMYKSVREKKQASQVNQIFVCKENRETKIK